MWTCTVTKHALGHINASLVKNEASHVYKTLHPGNVFLDPFYHVSLEMVPCSHCIGHSMFECILI